MDIFPVEALVTNLHPSAKCANCWKIFNREADRLGGRRKTTTNAGPNGPTARALIRGRTAKRPTKTPDAVMALRAP